MTRRKSKRSDKGLVPCFALKDAIGARAWATVAPWARATFHETWRAIMSDMSDASFKAQVALNEAAPDRFRWNTWRKLEAGLYDLARASGAPSILAAPRGAR